MKLTKQLTNKLLVCGFIWLLTFVSIASLVQPANAYASDGIEITSLPVTITESETYYLTGDLECSGSNAITIDADNVIINGNGHTITVDAAYNGVTVQDHSGIELYDLNIDGSKDAFHIVNCNNFMIFSTSINGPDEDSFYISGCSNFNLTSSNIIDAGFSGMELTDVSEFQIGFISINGSGKDGISIDGGNTFYLFNIVSQYNGVNLDESWCGLYIEDASDFAIDYSNLNGNDYGIGLDECSLARIDTCGFDSNGYGMQTWDGSTITVQNCMFTNQTIVGCLAYDTDGFDFDDNVVDGSGVAGSAFSDGNYTATNNLYSNNGYATWTKYGGYCGLAVSNANCSVSENRFENNANAVYFLAMTDEDSKSFNDICAVEMETNDFQNNNYTLLFVYEYASGFKNQSFVFCNNLVNDTAYVHPAGLQMTGECVPIDSSVFSFNKTVEFDRRIYSIAPFAGGNFWAHPDGSGPSQIGIDANRDGFLDAPLELFGNATVGAAYDYHAYSDKFDPNQWINITLPATIFSPGHYRVANSYNGSESALLIFANDVVVDGQNIAFSHLLETDIHQF